MKQQANAWSPLFSGHWVYILYKIRFVDGNMDIFPRCKFSCQNDLLGEVFHFNVTNVQKTFQISLLSNRKCLSDRSVSLKLKNCDVDWRMWNLGFHCCLLQVMRETSRLRTSSLFCIRCKWSGKLIVWHRCSSDLVKEGDPHLWRLRPQLGFYQRKNVHLRNLNSRFSFLDVFWRISGMTFKRKL